MTKYLLVTHGDFDGIASAVGIMAAYGLPLSETQIVFTQPFLLGNILIDDDVEQIFVADIAVNNRDPQMTKNFISLCGDRLAKWVDHHQGWPEWFRDNSRFLIIPEAKSCASIVCTDLQMMNDADVVDSRSGELSPRGRLINRAIKAEKAESGDSIRLTAVKWLLGDDSQKPILEEAEKKYCLIVKPETDKIVRTYRIIGNTAIADARKSKKPYDMTELLLEGEKLARFALVHTAQPKFGEGITIATLDGSIDLSMIFELPSGSPSRVSLRGKKPEEALQKLINLQ